MKKILFLLKENHYSASPVSSDGLVNSTLPIVEYLRSIKHQCKVVHVIDANFIDHEIHKYKPDVVVLEAVWVEAIKLRELMHLNKHRGIQWVVRVHSNMGFLAAEPHSIRVLRDYIELDNHELVISFTNKEFEQAISNAWNYNFTCLPTIVKTHKKESSFSEERRHIHVGCFGALRLAKNQCFQAVCAMQAANALDKKLYFHVTAQPGDDDSGSILSALRALFYDSNHELVVHNWMPLTIFLNLVKEMDFGMQLSFTESFNIVAADFVNCDKIVIVSETITWMPPGLKVSTTDHKEVVDKILHVYEHRNDNLIKSFQTRFLKKYNDEAKKVWSNFLGEHHKHQEY